MRGHGRERTKGDSEATTGDTERRRAPRRSVVAPRVAVLAILWLGFGCAGRQAVVESDPRGGAETRRQLEAAARSDLDALRRAEGEHRAARGRYTYDLEALGVAPSPGVTLSVLEATGEGFSALATVGSVECAVFVGSADPPRGYASTAGVVACRP